jgi:hypothetical protein
MSVTILNTDAGLTAKTLVNAEDGQTVTGLKTYDRDPNPPFAVTSGSANVPNLDADKVDGVDVATLAANRVPYAASASSLTNSSGLTFDGTTLSATAITQVGATSQLTLTGGQVVFPATQVPSAGVNTLDDYEEGTWTPVIGGSGGTAGQTYSVQNGYYTKIGKMVIVQFNVVLTGKGTITTGVQIQGLPFTVENNTNGQSIGALQWANLATTWTSIILQGAINSTAANVVGTTVAAVSNGTALTTADINNNTQFLGTLCYRASA